MNDGSIHMLSDQGRVTYRDGNGSTIVITREGDQWRAVVRYKKAKAEAFPFPTSQAAFEWARIERAQMTAPA